MDPEALKIAVGDEVENVVLVSRIASTHDLALGLLEQAEKDDIKVPPTLILAESQGAGHGRSGRPWVSPDGGLYLSLIRCDLGEAQLPRLPMLAAVAAARTLAEAGAPVGIKWPNDLVAGGRKMGGLLFHTRRGDAQWAVVSLGLNVAAIPELPPETRISATCLAEQLGEGVPTPSPEDLAASFLSQLSSTLAAGDTPVVAWRELLVHREGERLEVHLEDGTTVTGSFGGVTEEGYLRLQTAEGERILGTGDVGLAD